MKKDIKDRADIELLINRFYDEVRKDDLLGRYFAHVKWDTHLLVMYNFWENALFFTGTYTGNPLKIHMDFHLRFPLSHDLFKRWESLFIQTLDALFAGEKAELARQRAYSISTVMQIKMFPENK